MAIFKCECGLITSTPDRITLCVRCRRALGPRDRVDSSPPLSRIDGVTATPGVHIRLACDDVPDGLKPLPAAKRR